VTTGLERIAAKSRKETDCRFTSLVHHITPSLLQDSLRCIARSSASGVDRESVEEAREQFAVWSKEIIQQIHQKGYRPPPVRRVYIPKPGKQEKRPIGVPTVRDRCIQRATATVLQQVYEPDFLEHSFGGRPGRSAHDALSTLTRTISTHKISWVFEADLKNFFGSLDHGWLLRFVEHRVGDPRILTMIRRWLKAGVMEAGRVDPTERGTPQGGSISVLLSNIYLHYVLDIWFGKVVKPRLEGQAYMCRYLDDFVVCFQLKRDAERFQKALKGRLGVSGH
jgi:RNA-directed DNA polymerase